LVALVNHEWDNRDKTYDLLVWILHLLFLQSPISYATLSHFFHLFQIIPSPVALILHHLHPHSGHVTIMTPLPEEGSPRIEWQKWYVDELFDNIIPQGERVLARQPRSGDTTFRCAMTYKDIEKILTCKGEEEWQYELGVFYELVSSVISTLHVRRRYWRYKYIMSIYNIIIHYMIGKPGASAKETSAKEK